MRGFRSSMQVGGIATSAAFAVAAIRWRVRVLMVMLALFLGVLSTAHAREPEVKGGLLEFALPDLEDHVVSSSDTLFENKVVYVTLWGTWCPPCRTEIPTLNDLQNRYGDEGLVVVGIAFEKDTLAVERREVLRRFSQEYEIEYLVLDGGATTDFSEALPMVDYVKGLPVEILINRSGEVIESRNSYGYKKRWARELEREINKLLSQAR